MRSLLRDKSYFLLISYVFYGLLEDTNSSDEPYNLLAMPGGSNKVNVVVFKVIELILLGRNIEQSDHVHMHLMPESSAWSKWF